MKPIAAVVIAAGHGSFRTSAESDIPFPKVLETIEGEPMVVRILKTVLAAGFAPCIVIGNNKSTPLISDACNAAGLVSLRFATQPAISGAADAAALALPHLRNTKVGNFLAIYGDMPLWSVRTLKNLADSHRRLVRTNRGTISMVTVRRNPHYPELDRYGRVLRDHTSRIVRIVEPAQATPRELAAPSVNPSLWIFNRDWFASRVRKVVPVARWEGQIPERYLPPLVGISASEGRRIGEVAAGPDEALGVNTTAELLRVRAIAAANR